MRIVYGGSFDPMHKGHLGLINTALFAYPEAEVIVAPTINHAFNKDLKPYEVRMDILNTSIVSYFSGYDDNRLNRITVIPSEKYMVDFIDKIGFDKSTDAILIGSDIVCELEKWKDFDEIRKCLFLISPRMEYKEYDLFSFSQLRGIEKLERYKLLPEVVTTSSSEIKAMIETGLYSTSEEWLQNQVMNPMKVFKHYNKEIPK